jgi:retron-type reverse transcriptase
MSNIRNSIDDRVTNTSVGVPQGAATSPILANLIMQKWIDSFYPPSICIAYADDSITASDKEILIPRSHPKIN